MKSQWRSRVYGTWVLRHEGTSPRPLAAARGHQGRPGGSPGQSGAWRSLLRTRLPRTRVARTRGMPSGRRSCGVARRRFALS